MEYRKHLCKTQGLMSWKEQCKDIFDVKSVNPKPSHNHSKTTYPIGLFSFALASVDRGSVRGSGT
ncbi:hypothetical protein M378DRAFT_171757 [Amanita muscaria Koide BX008]|uniref:Uncharacterized protein n=1 Tax=Amanita muscaria (strain Koide BX008) TaxID=946122 RepID=A0A0C2WL70_AMAMK|nr:hypothetical protein M378DRAFT_171757 [Amanita muscaria Koide BX008]